MASPAANKASFFFECASLPPDTFDVLRFVGTEAISSLYTYEVLLASEDEDVDMDSVLDGVSRFILVRDGEEVTVNGIVVDFEQLGQVPDHTIYRAVLKPAFWNLTQSTQSRVFQNLSVVDIVSDVLGDVAFRFDLKGSYDARTYCVQYRETDFAFVSRLLEFEGIAYYFEQSASKDTVVFTDYQSYEPIDGDDTIAYDPEGSLRQDIEEAVTALSYRKRAVPGRVVLKDYNYETPEQELRAEAGQAGPTYYDYGQHFEDLSTGKRLAKVRVEELQSQREVIRGQSDCAGFQTGYTYALERHYRSDFNKDYLLIEIRHEGSQGQAKGDVLGYSMAMSLIGDGNDKATLYRNAFVSIPATVPFRPARTTPLPEVPGVLTARIESAGGDNYAYLDEDGRYRVKMPFDLESTTKGSSSKPVRLTQPHAGADYGMHFPNHDQVEMIWACVNGDVDRPIALGVVPNASTKSPSRSPNRMQNVLRTFSGNQMVMDDTVDKATVQVNTPDENTVLLDDAEDRIHIVTTKKHTATLDDKNARIRLKTTSGHLVTMQDKGDKKNDKKGHMLVQSKAGHVVRLQDDGDDKGHILVQTTMGHVITINDKDEHITLQDEAKENHIVIDIKNNNITLETKKGSIDLKAPKGKVAIECTDFVVKAKNDASIDAKQNVTVKAGMKYSQAGLDIESKAQMKHEIAGLQVKSEAQLANDVAGVQVSVKGTAMTVIQGGLVKIN
ncbi:MAG: type VI secretion system tip protein TssI/VgrG [Bacteroidota bacterium]